MSASLQPSSQARYGAFAQHKFPKGFIMDEEHLRRLNDIITRRLTPALAGALQYRIYRTDSNYYVTSDITDIIAEDNFGPDRITKLLASVDRGDEFSLELSFGDKGVELIIRGDDRDFVFLIFSDLKQYINSEMLSFYLSPRSLRLVLNLMPLGFMLSQLFLIPHRLTRAVSSEDVTLILESAEVVDKLNYLIRSENATRSFSMPTWPFVVAVCLVLFFMFLETRHFEPLAKYLVPANLFLFGKEVERHKKRMESRSRFFWGVIVASLVSAVTGVAVWYVTKSA